MSVTALYPVVSVAIVSGMVGAVRWAHTVAATGRSDHATVEPSIPSPLDPGAAVSSFATLIGYAGSEASYASPSWEPSMTVSTGMTLDDRYVLLRPIASGGMGDVWEASDRRLGRQVAVKILKGHLGQDEATRSRFRFEAQAAAGLTSSGIATVFDYGEDAGDQGDHRAYIVMELVHGDSLADRVLLGGPLTVTETLDVMRQAALALQVAHDRGLIHRDIKPANLILRPDGVVKLTDFGIARAFDSSSLTQTGTMVGTVRYMSPEQLSGEIATPASDLYALGIVGYFCLAGHTPFEFNESMAIALAHVRDPAPPMPPAVPPEVEGFILQLLEKNPHRRPPSAAAVASKASALMDRASTFTAIAGHREISASTPVSGLPLRGDRGASIDQGETAPTLIDYEGTAVLPVSAPFATGAVSRPLARRRLRVLIPSLAVMAIAVTLILYLLQGPARLVVPRLVGIPAAAATARIDKLGLHFEEHHVDVNRPDGLVVAQTPEAGTSILAGASIVLRTASGFVDVDAASLVGQAPGQVVPVLSSIGVRPTQTTVVSTATPGTVVSIAPSGRVRRGTPVVISVAVAPPPPTTTTTTTTTDPTASTSQKKPAKDHHH